MTISYSGNIVKLLFRWKGSLWKAVWAELLLFLTAYYSISAVYRSRILGDSKKVTFEYVAVMFDGFTRRIPITFLLGFYVTSVVRRWWEQFQLVAWPDDVLSYTNILFPGEVYRLKRRTIARWLNLTAALAWRDVSVSVRKRFPTLEHVVKSGLMTDHELNLYNKLSTPTNRWFLPVTWIQRLVEHQLMDPAAITGTPPLVAHFLRELNEYRHCFRQLYCYDWVCLPLVYTQVAALATYGYFTLCLIGRQYLDASISVSANGTVTEPQKRFEGREVDLVVPIFTILQFTFYVGWFKVGQYLMRPFEEDDDDLELNYMLDRHLQASFALVDEVPSMFTAEMMKSTQIDGDCSETQVHQLDPIITEDHFLSQKTPMVPYTKMSAKEKQHPPKLHTQVVVAKNGDGETVDLVRNPKKHLHYF